MELLAGEEPLERRADLVDEVVRLLYVRVLSCTTSSLQEVTTLIAAIASPRLPSSSTLRGVDRAASAMMKASFASDFPSPYVSATCLNLFGGICATSMPMSRATATVSLPNEPGWSTTSSVTPCDVASARAARMSVSVCSTARDTSLSSSSLPRATT